jgi:hypothetical protein
MQMVRGALACVLLLLSFTVRAQQPRATESEIKAAYLLNFAKFVQWPADGSPAADPLKFCVLGRDPFGPVLDSLVAGQQIGGKNIVIRRLSRAADAVGCHLLFIDASENPQLTADLSALGNMPVLTVSEIPDFVSHGGIIQFVLKDNRVRFEINLGNAERVGLSLSARLLNVALSVRRN